MKTEKLPPSPAVTLTHQHATSSLPVEANVFASGSNVLEVVITKVVNPAKTPVAIFVYLSNTEKGKSEPEQISVGNFSLYPPDRPGKFLLSAGSALHRVSASATTLNAHDVRVVFEMKRIDETKPWTSVEVTIAQPNWRAAER